jgi:hypothetical protein
MRRATVGCTLALFITGGLLRALSGAGTAPAASAPSTCGPSCLAAYRVIARALPEDRTDQLARAIAATSGFDYARLARVLRIPTTAQLRAQWRSRCDALFPGDRASAARCFALILPSTYRYLDEIPA